MKKTAPLVLGIVVGLYACAEFYIPDWHARWLTQELQTWAAIIAAFAYVLGGVNLLQVNVPKIRRRERDWQYKVVMVAAAAIMLIAGIKWHKVYLDHPAFDAAVWTRAGGAPAGKAIVEVDAPADVMVKVGPNPAAPARDAAGHAYRATVDAGPVPVRVFRRVSGYRDYDTTIEVAAGRTTTIAVDPPMLWGAQGRVYAWLYDHVFAPCNATMFALLAFFVVSAAFRAFRMRNVEATLLLGAAILLLIAAAPMGAWISGDLVDLGQWILDIPNNAGRRAIMMGAAIGAIATSLRIVLGLERSHLGAD